MQSTDNHQAEAGLFRGEDMERQVERPYQHRNGNEVVPDSDEVTKNDRNKRLVIIRLIACLVGVVLIALIVVLIVWATHKNNNNVKQSPPAPHHVSDTNSSSHHNNKKNSTITSNNSTHTATSAPSTQMPISAPNKTKNCADFPCSSDMTVMELVDVASNHALLAEFLNRYFNSDLRDYVASSRHEITLLAPTDASFRALEPPHSFYFQDGYAWAIHLYILLATHILDKSQSAEQIFQKSSIQTFLSSFALTVNNMNRTIENGVSITTQDVQASNGYIQVPDGIVLVSVLHDSLLDYVEQQNYRFSNDITKFRELILATGLENLLSQFFENGLTLFVPQDSAFDLLGTNVSSLLFETPNAAFIKNFILYHILDLNLVNLVPQAEYSFYMLNNVSVWFTNNNPNNDTYINSVALAQSYAASNGVFHVLDQVLLPPNIGEMLQITSEVTSEYNVTTFIDIVNDNAHLGHLFNGELKGHPNLGNYFTGTDYLTVFAPVQDAIANLDPKLLKSLLKPSWLLHLQSLCLHHFTVGSYPDSQGQYQLAMLSGFNLTLQVLAAGSNSAPSNQTIDGATVKAIPGSIGSFLDASSGVIRFIDQVLLPPWVGQSVFDRLVLVTDVSAFFSVIRSANMEAILSDTDRPYTVFAPNNDAMKKLGYQASSFQDLAMRHIVWGNQYTSTLTGPTVVTLANTTLAVTTTTNSTYIGRALILASNILASNGVIQVINRVL